MSISAELTTATDAGLTVIGGGISGTINLSDTWLAPRENAILGRLSLSNGSNLHLFDFDGRLGVQASADALSFDSTCVFVIQIVPGKTSRMTVRGNVVLGNVRLQFSVDQLTPLPAEEIRIIDNLGDDPVTGTFAGLPEGAVVGEPSELRKFTVSYKGGTGNDVVLIPIQLAASTIEVTTSPNPSAPGQIVKMTAKVRTSADPPTGDVIFQFPPSPIGISFICKGTLDATGVASCTTDRFANLPSATFYYLAAWDGMPTTFGSRSPMTGHGVVSMIPTLDLRMLALLAAALAMIAMVALSSKMT